MAKDEDEILEYIEENAAEVAGIVMLEVRKAVSKQIPKKPTYEGDGYDRHRELIYDTWICPNCEAAYEVDYDHYDYCPKCGQRIDWTEEEDGSSAD